MRVQGPLCGKFEGILVGLPGRRKPSFVSVYSSTGSIAGQVEGAGLGDGRCERENKVRYRKSLIQTSWAAFGADKGLSLVP